MEGNVTQFMLGPLSISFPLGKLSLVTGTNGSGKTALLSALLGGPYKRCCHSGEIVANFTT